MKKDLSKFFFKVFLLSSPIIFFIGLYFVCDPFKVIYKEYQFENYYDQQPYDLNREFVSTELLMVNKNKYNYDSYIFGSCLSFTYHSDEWRKYIKTEGEIFHFPAASETLFGINKKIKFLDTSKFPIKNCLLIMDATTIKETNQRFDYMHAMHPAISGQNQVMFQVDMLKSFFSNMFCLQYLDYKLTGKVKNYMKNNFGISPKDIEISPKNNEFFYAKLERELKQDSLNFYKLKSDMFLVRDTTKKVYLEIPIIKEKQVVLLNEIKSIFKKHNTHYKIVLSPMYNQVYFNKDDLKKLKEIFGAENVYDYTGINQYTCQICNYYDNFHYKPLISNKILNEIYK